MKSQSSYIEWCNENEGRAYPLRDETRRVDNYGQPLPDDILVDLGVIVPPEYSDVYCTTIRVTPNVFSVCLASSAGTLLLGTYAASSYVPYTVVPLTPMVPDVSGWVVFGSHRRVVNETYVFSSAVQSGIVSRAVRVVDRIPVRRFYKYGGANVGYLDQIVRMAGGGLLRIYRDPENGQQMIAELDKRQTENFLGPCDHYADAGQCRAAPIRSINGVTADADGVLTLRFLAGAV
jgi:hypothetical protein